MGRSIIFFLILFLSRCLFAQDTSTIFLTALNKIEKGDTSFFYKQIKSADTSNNFAYYLCLAKINDNKASESGLYELYKKALELANTNKEKAIAHLRLGIYYNKKELLVPALEEFNKAELLYSFKIDEPEYIALHKNIGIINSYAGSKEKSNERFLKVYEAAKRKNNKKLIATSANNIAVNYIELGKYDDAEKYLNLSLQLRIEANDKFLMGQSYNNFGSLYFDKGDYEKAVQFYNKSYILRKNFSNNLSSITESEINLGKTYLKLNKTAEAETMLRNAFDKGKEIGHIKFIAMTADYLKDIYFKKKAYKEAFEMQKEYLEAKDSLYGYAKREEISKLTISNEFKGKQISDSLQLVKKDSEIKIKESTNAKNKLMLGSLAIVLGLVIFIGFNLFRQKKREQEKNRLISAQSSELKAQHKEIKDSINYAMNLQQSLLPSSDVLESFLKEYFILYLPKDVVSGDFYWAASVRSSVLRQAQDDKLGVLSDTPYSEPRTPNPELFYFALGDCTGHGVPGAMVSIVGITALTRCVKEFKLKSPAEILQKLSVLVSEAFSHNNKQLNDGMDISFCSISGKTLKWAGANNLLWIVRNNQVIEFKGTRRPVGAFINDIPFKEESIELMQGDTVYMVTDGFSDQFGGVSGKKFKQSNLKEFILSIHALPCDEQKNKLRKRFDEWRVKLEQLDDVSVIGFRI